MSWQAVILAAAAYLLTVTGVGLWRRLALRRSLLDAPNERRSHTQQDIIKVQSGFVRRDEHSALPDTVRPSRYRGF
ncbi:MAG: hypothetical protein LH614_02735 [Pyrinomonadaceae bacterium]|nr:hypothetical protein [Pyrinomonadaceae bacterium]